MHGVLGQKPIKGPLSWSYRGAKFLFLQRGQDLSRALKLGLKFMRFVERKRKLSKRKRMRVDMRIGEHGILRSNNH